MGKREDENVQLLRDLSRLVRNLTRLLGGPQEDADLTPTQRVALIELADRGALRLSELAGRMGVSAPTASRSVDVLHERGLAERVPDPRDRRALNIELTDAGRVWLHSRFGEAQTVFAPAVNTLSAAERSQLTALLRRMTEALEDDAQ